VIARIGRKQNLSKKIDLFPQRKTIISKLMLPFEVTSITSGLERKLHQAYHLCWCDCWCNERLAWLQNWLEVVLRQLPGNISYHYHDFYRVWPGGLIYQMNPCPWMDICATTAHIIHWHCHLHGKPKCIHQPQTPNSKLNSETPVNVRLKLFISNAESQYPP
jgi:hypothetical protein